MLQDDPIDLGHGVWWVGMRLPNDRFQSHAYYLHHPAGGVLFDPGSPVTIEATMAKVARIADPQSIRWLVCHHPDPDIASALPWLSEVLQSDQVKVVTEWRAAALIKFYGFRFETWLVEEHGWRLPLGDDRVLEFQLTPYLHFPGAFVTYDSTSGILFSSDLFGGFVPRSDVLVSDDLPYILEAARPFHQHYMPSTELLAAGLKRIQRRWPRIDRIAPQHGHIIASGAVAGAFEGLSRLQCGVFSIGDADDDLRRLLRLAETRTRLIATLLDATEPGDLTEALNHDLGGSHRVACCTLWARLPGQAWVHWSGRSQCHPSRLGPPDGGGRVALPGEPPALLLLATQRGAALDPDLLDLLRELAPGIRQVLDRWIERSEAEDQLRALQAEAHTDPLTGLLNRRALEQAVPEGSYGLICLDLDRFKAVNDTYGHDAGDRVLLRVVQALQSCHRQADRLYRLGGEEFLITLPQADAETVRRVAERSRQAVKDLPLQGLAPGGRITISAGVVAVKHQPRSGFQACLRTADRALYEAKRRGGDSVVVEEPPDPPMENPSA
jgi:diguanylate cyclase (GGDEF)-like protein